MPFEFVYVCDLFAELDANRYRKASAASRATNPDRATVINWFLKHQRRMQSGNTDLLALLSCLFPEKRTDRVLALKEASLVRIIGKSLRLGKTRKSELENWKKANNGDLGSCVEAVMAQSENVKAAVTVELINNALDEVAAKCRFSCYSLQQEATAKNTEAVLRDLLLQMHSSEAKWFVRMILKDYRRIALPEALIIYKVHYLLPALLKVQNELSVAVASLNHLNAKKNASSSGGPNSTNGRADEDILSPRVGVKVGRPTYLKARSIKHCCDMAGGRRMSLERKYDGEYCQIHVDLSSKEVPIRIFSKSGRDSTLDREGIHNAISECLQLRQYGGTVKSSAILEGEVLVWVKDRQGIAEFHKIRKHIHRSGIFLGAAQDSPPGNENLFIIFYDVLLVDHCSYIMSSHEARRRLLKRIVKPVPGFVDIASREVVDFSAVNGPSQLRKIFARAVRKRWEGLVLKASEEPYLDISQKPNLQYPSCWIKLKKDYIVGLGDCLDFAVIGAGYDSRQAYELDDIPNLSWTRFHIGCMENKEAFDRLGEQPCFRHVGYIQRPCISKQDVVTLNQLGRFMKVSTTADDSARNFVVKEDQQQLPRMSDCFNNPVVLELIGSSFHKPPCVSYYMLRFPRVQKIHMDRTFRDATTFQALQDFAEDALASPSDIKSSQEDAIWIARLEGADPRSKYILDNSQETTSSSTGMSVSPKSTIMASIGTPAQSLFLIETDETCDSFSNERLDDVVQALDATCPGINNEVTSISNKRKLMEEPFQLDAPPCNRQKLVPSKATALSLGSNKSQQHAQVTRPLRELRNLGPRRPSLSPAWNLVEGKQVRSLQASSEEQLQVTRRMSPKLRWKSRRRCTGQDLKVHNSADMAINALPSPPTSSAETARSTNEYGVQTPTQSTHSETFALDVETSVLFAPNLSTSLIRTIQQQLHEIPRLPVISFTRSSTYFLDTLTERKSNASGSLAIIGIVLVSKDAGEIGALLSDIGSALTARRRQMACERGKVVFLDVHSFRCLLVPYTVHTASFPYRTFYGCLKWGVWANESLEQSEGRVRDSWQWQELLQLR